MRTASPPRQLGFMSPLLNEPCCMKQNDYWAQPLQLLTNHVIIAVLQNQADENDAVKHTSVACQGDQGFYFPTLMSTVPCSLFTAVKKSHLASNQIKQVKPCICSVTLVFQVIRFFFSFPLYEEGKSPMCSMSFTICKQHEGRRRRCENKFGE